MKTTLCLYESNTVCRICNIYIVRVG